MYYKKSILLVFMVLVLWYCESVNDLNDHLDNVGVDDVVVVGAGELAALMRVSPVLDQCWECREWSSVRSVTAAISQCPAVISIVSSNTDPDIYSWQ